MACYAMVLRWQDIILSEAIGKFAEFEFQVLFSNRSIAAYLNSLNMTIRQTSWLLIILKGSGCFIYILCSELLF